METRRKPVAGIVMTCLFIVGGFVAPYYTYLGLYNAPNWFYKRYAVPWCRCNSYFIGIFLGYLMLKTNCTVKIRKVGVVFCWICALLLMAIACSPWNIIFYFEPLHRPMFALGVFWVVFACCSGHGGVINLILSWRGWIPLAKLTYTGYLIHPILIYATYYSQRHQIYITYWTLIYYYLGHLMMTLGLSFVATLFLEVPFVSLERIMLINVNRTPHAKTDGNKADA